MSYGLIASLLIGLLVTSSNAYAESPVIKINKAVTIAGDLIEIEAKTFPAKSNVIFRIIKDGNEYTRRIDATVENEHIILNVPQMEVIGEFDVTVQGMINNSSVESGSVKLVVTENGYVRDALTMKKSGASEAEVLTHFERVAQQDLDAGAPGKPEIFSGVKLAARDYSALRTGGFSSDFCEKLEGQYQYVTVGMAGIWLFGSAEMVAAPMVRIFLTPKSFFKPRQELFTLNSTPSKWFSGMKERFDLNVGVTATDTEIDSDGTKEETKYVLVGLSFEINRSALLNFGYARALSHVSKEKGQMYLGVTLDQNVLKELGLVAKQ